MFKEDHFFQELTITRQKLIKSLNYPEKSI